MFRGLKAYYLANYLIGHLKFDTLIPYQSYTKYWNPQINQSVSDKAWDEINTNPVAIALSNDYVKEHGLTESTRFPWDTERSVYYVKGLHDLHCLVRILHSAGILAAFSRHVRNCFDELSLQTSETKSS